MNGCIYFKNREDDCRFSHALNPKRRYFDDFTLIEIIISKHQIVSVYLYLYILTSKKQIDVDVKYTGGILYTQ